jgi:hypothetical protein
MPKPKPYFGLSDSMTFLDPSTLVDGIADPGFVGAFGIGPVGASTSLTYALYLTERGDSNAISLNDIHQGYIGDCFLLSPIGEIARVQPSFIANMVHVNSNGTETVTLYNANLSNWYAKSWKPVAATVSNVFQSNSVNSGAGQDVVGNQKEIWPQVLEKAVATLNGGVNGSLAPIANGGYPFLAMEQLTGKPASWMSPASLTLPQLLNMVAAHDLLTFDTYYSNQQYNLVGNHSYMFEGVTGSGAAAVLHFGNPWGFDQPAPIPFSQVSRVFAQVDVGHVA